MIAHEVPPANSTNQHESHRLASDGWKEFTTDTGTTARTGGWDDHGARWNQCMPSRENGAVI